MRHGRSWLAHHLPRARRGCRRRRRRRRRRGEPVEIPPRTGRGRGVLLRCCARGRRSGGLPFLHRPALRAGAGGGADYRTPRLMLAGSSHCRPWRSGGRARPKRTACGGRHDRWRPKLPRDAGPCSCGRAVVGKVEPVAAASGAAEVEAGSGARAWVTGVPVFGEVSGTAAAESGPCGRPAVVAVTAVGAVPGTAVAVPGPGVRANGATTVCASAGTAMPVGRAGPSGKVV